MSFNQSTPSSLAPFSDSLLKIEDYKKRKEPIIRKFEKVEMPNFTTHEHQLTFSLMHHCQEVFLKQEIYPKLNHKIGQHHRNRMHLVNLSFQHG